MITKKSLEDTHQCIHRKNQNKIHNIFWAKIEKISMVIISEKNIEEILTYLEKSIMNLAKQTFENFEIGGEFQEIEKFLENQFELRLENSLAAKNSSTHYLESGMKNKIIQRKQKIFEKISKQYRI